MRLLVGTLYTIENEFDKCRDAINHQSYKNFEHVIIKDLPNKEAHDTLYSIFMKRSSEFDLLVKIDADMVITDTKFFEKIVEKFSGDNDLDLLIVAVNDFFTDMPILGINIFRNTVRWEIKDNHLFTDMVHDNKTIRKSEKDFNDLAPAADHCPDPGPYQAFHFGFHRGMKAYIGGWSWNVLVALVNHYKRNQDVRLAYAVLGANTAFSGKFSVHNISYNDDTLLNYFNENVNGMDDKSLNKKIGYSKLYWLLTLPIDRRILYRYYHIKSKLVQ